MKVLIVGKTRIWGGLEVHAITLAGVLAERGDDVSIGCIDAETYELYARQSPAGIRLTRLTPPEHETVRGWLRTFRDVDADAVMLEKGTLATGGLALDVALRWRYGTYVAVMQLEPPPLPPKSSKRFLAGLVPGLGLWWHRWRFMGWTRSWFPTMTVCVSDAVRRRLVVEYGFPQRRLMTIHNGVDYGDFQFDVSRRQRIRDAFGVPANAFVFGSVGRLSDQKALDIAIQAFAEIRATAQGRSAFLLCVGEGAERDRLVALADRLGVSDAIRLPGFSQSPAQVYQALDVFLIPSRHEGLPFALIEALASGCLVIGSTVGGIPEVITNPTLGLLVPPENPTALAAAMRQAMLMPAEERARRSQAGRARIIEAFDIRMQCLKYVSVLDTSRSEPS
jgi:glycosyltransferase involved in cell wall biosynthesis